MDCGGIEDVLSRPGWPGTIMLRFVSMVEEPNRLDWHLLPSETVLWHAGKLRNVPRDRFWIVAPIGAFGFAVVAALFAALLSVVGLAGARDTALLSTLCSIVAVGLLLLPHYLFDDFEYVVTDRRILVRRGRLRRSMERDQLTYGRLRWHRSMPGVGTIELVVATPYGPLSRRLRLTIRDVRDPDRVLALIRGGSPSDYAGDRDVPLAERLDSGESVVWGGHPEGLMVGWREALSGTFGLILTGLGFAYGYRTAAILLNLELVGLRVLSSEWMLLFSAVTISWALIVSCGLGLMWHGWFRTRALGRDTEYVLTEHRLLVRRGLIELSVNRDRIADAAITRVRGELSHLCLVLDSPRSRALADSGALRVLLPPRDTVPPVLYDLRDAAAVRALIVGVEPDASPAPPTTIH